MTTIAYRAGTLAADTLIAYDTFLNGDGSKIAKCGRYWVALAGKAWLRRPLEQWAADGCPEDEVPVALMDNQQDFSCILIDVDGSMWTFNQGFLIPIAAEYHAIGSGMFFALGAMAHGATAEEAVAAAMRHDKNTGGTVQTVSIPLN